MEKVNRLWIDVKFDIVAVGKNDERISHSVVIDHSCETPEEVDDFFAALYISYSKSLGSLVPSVVRPIESLFDSRFDRTMARLQEEAAEYEDQESESQDES